MTHSDAPVRFALIGCGSIAKTQIKALKQLPDRADIACLCDYVTDRAAELENEFGYPLADFESILADPTIEAVTFCTPSGVHGEQAERALLAGKHVIVEKPMDVSIEACEALKAVADASDRTFSVISQHRFDPASQLVRKTMDAGQLGRLIFTEARIPWYRTQKYYDSGDWRGTWELDGGGCLMNQGIHTVDLMHWFAGPVKRVMARMATTAHERIEVEDVLTATLEFESGMIGTLTASTAFYPGFPVSLGLFGTSGSAIIEGDELHTLAIQGQETIHGKGSNAHALQVATGGTRSATKEAHKPSEEAWKWGDAHRAQLANFIDCIRSGDTPVVTAADGLNAVRLIKSCYASAQSDSWVEL